ncbi:hypothetical protein NDU88_006121 [Pleurodeles waltl]|uniref:Uncharacterized protein n=1 Tax=Pleurodeles waltl TaxID=8319 RepID=A0AAV7UKL4_PLEWA|nr:hypothetical protein NDU88_006121 [Pleurodeles waltl]
MVLEGSSAQNVVEGKDNTPDLFSKEYAPEEPAAEEVEPLSIEASSNVKVDMKMQEIPSAQRVSIVAYAPVPPPKPSD